MKKIFLILLIAFTFSKSFSQNVGIGTTTPNPKAILDVKATDKGILFPRLTTAQRDAIATPPNGLHIFNTDDGCLNYYDSVHFVWSCYCRACETQIITISASISGVDFYNAYAKNMISKSYAIVILPGVIISAATSCYIHSALSFEEMPFNADITITNYGKIMGYGGAGGIGTFEQSPCGNSNVPGWPGSQGGDAITGKAGVKIKVINYGLIAGSGGGGGGSGAGGTPSNPLGYGGGGGGGAGMYVGPGGKSGGYYVLQSGTPPPILPPSTCDGPVYKAAAGLPGSSIIGGNGGAGFSGGYTGGHGGSLGLAGTNGSGTCQA